MSRQINNPLVNYLEQLDATLYNVFDDLCLLSLLKVRGNGITFLYPTDKQYREQIKRHAYSNSPETAVSMIKSLILLDYLPTPMDFSNKKDDIPNAHRKKLQLKSVTSQTVTLVSEHVLTADNNFSRYSRGEPIAVYHMTGADELTTGGDPSSIEYQSSTSKRVNQSKQHMPEKDLAACIEGMYCKGQSNAYIGIMGMLYGSIVASGNSGIAKAVYNKLCASTRASFYSVVSPYNLEKDYNIGTAIESSGLCDLHKHTSSTIKKALKKGQSNYKTNLNNLINLSGISKEQQEEQLKKRTKLRNQLFSTISNPIDAKTGVINVYKNDANLYKDLLTMYCHIMEIQELDNRESFTNFIFNIKNIYNNVSSFTKTVTETGFALTLYYNLIKSDAFLYVPVVEINDLEKSSDNVCLYQSLNYRLPAPNNTALFTIQFNNVVYKEEFDTSDTSYLGGVLNSLNI